MSGKLSINLGDIQKTLLLPLWGRAVETLKPDPLLMDQTAVGIIHKMDYDFSVIARNIHPLTQLAWIGRSLLTDKIILQFLGKYPQATIVDIGCGMDTNFERVDNGSLQWYDLDLPDVIRLRRNFFQESTRRKFIEGSLFDEQWFEHVKTNDPVLLISAGVLYYFEERQVRDFICRIASRFSGSEILFDVASPLGLRIANKKVIEGGGFDERSFLRWGLKNLNEIKKWDERIMDIRRYSFYKDFRNKLDFKTRTGTIISDLLNIMYMVHLRFKK